MFVAKSGRLLLDPDKRTVELVLENGTQHTTSRDHPDEYDANAFESTVIRVDPDTIFPRTQIVKGDNEKTIAELRRTIAENTAHNAPSQSQLYTIQQKFSLPVACLVLALIGVALGATNSKDGKLASFALGTGVVFVYYIILYSARAGAFAGRLPASFAPWLVNVILGAAGVALVHLARPLRRSADPVQHPALLARQRRGDGCGRTGPPRPPRRDRRQDPAHRLAAAAAPRPLRRCASTCRFSCCRSARWWGSSTSRR